MALHFYVGLQALCCSDLKTQQDILAQIIFHCSSSSSPEHSAIYSSQPSLLSWPARGGNGGQHRILGCLSQLPQLPSAFKGNQLCPLVPRFQQNSRHSLPGAWGDPDQVIWRSVKQQGPWIHVIHISFHPLHWASLHIFLWPLPTEIFHAINAQISHPKLVPNMPL